MSITHKKCYNSQTIRNFYTWNLCFKKHKTKTRTCFTAIAIIPHVLYRFIFPSFSCMLKVELRKHPHLFVNRNFITIFHHSRLIPEYLLQLVAIFNNSSPFTLYYSLIFIIFVLFFFLLFHALCPQNISLIIISFTKLYIYN